MSRWLREPLFHFLLIGALIFLAYSQFGAAGAGRGEIIVSQGQQENLINTFTRTWQRPPTPEEFTALLDDHVRQEIAYREGVAMGLDQDDIVIRRRLRQKLELLAEDVASLAQPTEEDLAAYLAAHADDFRVEPRLTLRHVYFSRDRRGEAAAGDATELLARIATDGPDGDFEEFGDPLPLPYQLEDVRESELGRMFGQKFTDGLQGLETGRWAGPVESGFGLHLVFISGREAGRAPLLDEVRDTVQREWFAERRREAVERLYQRLAEGYAIEIEPLTAGEAAGSR